MRSFDPVTLGQHEADAWVAYYRRRWAVFLRAAVAMVRAGFGMSWPRTIHGAWLYCGPIRCGLRTQIMTRTRRGR